MRKIKIATLVLLCILTAGLCGIFAYGMTGHNIYVMGYDYAGSGSMHLVLEKEVPLDGIDNISVQYDMNSNDIYIYEREDNSLTVKEYSDLELTESEVSTVKVTGSSLEIKGKKRKGRNYIGFKFFSVGPTGGYTEIGLPSAYKGALALSTASGDISTQMDISLEKNFRAATSSGGIKIPNINAADASLSCSSGDVQVETISAGTNGEINIDTSSGDITVKQLTGKMKIGSSSGDVTLNQLTGETDINTSSGRVKSEFIAGNTRISTTSGDITVDRIDGNAAVGASSGTVKIYEGSGERTIKTTSGDIMLEGADSAWNIESSSGTVLLKASKGNGGIYSTSGDITLELDELTGDLDIDSSSGYARIKLSPDNAFDFEANTTSGDINTFFDEDLNFSKKGNSAHGTYGNNEQGNSIRVGTTSGDVQVTK